MSNHSSRDLSRPYHLDRFFRSIRGRYVNPPDHGLKFVSSRPGVTYPSSVSLAFNSPGSTSRCSCGSPSESAVL